VSLVSSPDKEWWLALRIEVLLESEAEKIPFVGTEWSGLGEEEGEDDFVAFWAARRYAASEPDVSVTSRSQSDWPVEMRS
jgi:hypothetical protein